MAKANAKNKPVKDKDGKTQKQTTLKGFVKVTDKDGAVKENAIPDTADMADDDTTEITGPSPTLPPIHDIPAIFADLVSHIPEIKDVAEHIRGRKLRVATMCSGTESPLLALGIIGKTISAAHGVKLEVDHVFSCEIEPFKQAYIERNFQPPLLFRDVCELGQDEAHTAYGALAKVPGNVDILVAGTSCVDYSNLNNQKQGIEDGGESGRTFMGMMSWVKKTRPPIVILENVLSAPWDKVAEYFAKCGYSAIDARLDTKTYYIPHTRMRGYLVAFDTTKVSSTLPNAWKDWVIKKLRRPASSTLDDFLLSSDDPRIHLARQRLVRENTSSNERRAGRTDWGRCESRHQRARLEEELGGKRPLTSWEEVGSCTVLDFAWGDWGGSQVERVWDLMDISLLRSALKGIDPSYKTQVWNLSQNVDRTIGSNKVGICPCLTPSMIPYITNRGGPMVGLEALSMQGLPIDELLLTRETEDQLADLAGNAMSTPVVGACILAALVVGRELLKAGDVEDDKDGMDVDVPTGDVLPVAERITGEEQLSEKPLNLAINDPRPLMAILADAEKSSRLCECEGRTDITNRELSRCKDCQTSSCAKCGGRPDHNPEPIDVKIHPRLPPSDFATELKSALPMCISLTNITQELLDEMRQAQKVTVEDTIWSKWSAAVLRAANSELRFVEPKRQEIWTVVYRSPNALLQLSLHPQQPEWRLFGFPEPSEPTNAPIRDLLQTPIGRFACVDGFLSGRWDFAFPFSATVSIDIKGVGESVPAWEARLGLVGKDYRDKTVRSQYQITVAEEDVDKFDRDVSGVYTLLDKCGTANSALHKKMATDSESNLPPLFFFLDPHRTNDSEDAFVFSISKKRCEYGESRPVIGKLIPSWRQFGDEDVQTVECTIPCRWVSSSVVELKASHGQEARFSVPGKSLLVETDNDACQSANALLVCKVPLRQQAGPEWPRGSWDEIDKVHERTTFKSLAWLLEPLRHALSNDFHEWQNAESYADHTNCERCAPSAPDLKWIKSKNKFVPFEDHVQAGKYERNLKSRPSAFVTQLKLDENETGIVRIGLNIPTLLHRALSRLPAPNPEIHKEAATVSWRLKTNFTPAASLQYQPFKIASNKLDKEHAQPPSFKIDLRTEQLRSLTWMLDQEAVDAPPFVEEEISEAVLAPLGWRAEGRAQRPVHVRGGVLADQVGYGKTAITLGLIDCTAKKVQKEADRAIPGKISVKATLVVVPPHLTGQWESEVKKFTGKTRFNVIALSTAANINKLTIQQVKDADIIVVASSLYNSDVYLDNLSAFAGSRDLPTKDGRHFNASLDKCLQSLATQTDLLQSDGPAAVVHQIRDARKKAQEEDAAEAALAQSKRLKGKAYKNSKAVEVKPQPAAPPTTRRVSTVEVVVPDIDKSLWPSRSSSSTDPGEQDQDSDAPKRPRRAAAKPVIISDDDESEEEVKPKKKTAVKSKSKGKKAPVKKGKVTKRKTAKSEASSDYEDSGMDDEDSETSEATVADDSDVESNAESSDAAPAKSKSKPKPKAKAAAKTSRKSVASSDQEDGAMDVDEEPEPSKKSKKRKADDDGDRPAKKRREDGDPWGLESKAVVKDWNQMKAPPLEMFHFARKTVDEFTYLKSKPHSLITRITADRHWVLSGTPPIHDFASVKTIAAFLGVHLGVDDEDEFKGQQKIRAHRATQTAVEKFHSFREAHSLDWHQHRHELGQVFLDRFLRQNVAEIDEIPYKIDIREINLPAAERAIYLELEHHLRALDMTIKRSRKNESDREKRLAQSLGESKTAEEALLKRCSHFDLDTKEENAMKACDFIVSSREKQRAQCEAELLKSIKAGLVREQKLPKIEESMFREYVRVTRSEGVGDADATKAVVDLLDKAGAKNFTRGTKILKELSKSDQDAHYQHREQTHEIRRLTKELVGRIRSLRFFTAVRDLQKETDTPVDVSCPHCGREHIPISELAVLSSCGHMGCIACVTACAENEECVRAKSDDGACSSAARVLNIVKADTLGEDDVDRDGRGKHFGLKLEQVMSLVKDITEQDERVLIFIQFPDLMKKVGDALKHNKIPYLEITGTANNKTKSLTKFQEAKKDGERVLLLNVMDESASGANLTVANHAIFISPLLTTSKENYKACETQAVGRLVRFGQLKEVQIYRFLSTNTIDMEIYEQRKKEGVVHT